MTKCHNCGAIAVEQTELKDFHCDACGVYSPTPVWTPDPEDQVLRDAIDGTL